jgi:type I restriction enzyme R subunit
MNKKNLSESDLCDKFIRPAMVAAGWSGMDQIYREFPLRAGRVVVRGKKAQRDPSTVLRADFALFYKANIPLAVVEAKDNQHAMGAGMQQAIQLRRPAGRPFQLFQQRRWVRVPRRHLRRWRAGARPHPRSVPQPR